MSAPLGITRTDYTSGELRALSGRCSDGAQVRRMLALALVLEGRPRTEAAELNGMDRQTLRDWAHRFNELGPDGLLDRHGGGVEARLSGTQKAELAALVEAGPNPERDGVVRWRRVDLRRVIKERFGVEYHERHVGVLLREMGFSHVSARPRHPAQNPEIIEAFKKTSRTRSTRI